MNRLRRGSFRLALAALLALVSAAADAAAGGYEPGRGLTFLDDRVTIGGYASLEASFLDQRPDRLEIEDLSLLTSIRLTDRWLVFAEAEVEDPVHVDGGGVGSGSNVFSLERLYTEWQAGNGLRVRAGQMLTPVGIWNEIHAEPLVWTSSRPLATSEFFDTAITGVAATASTLLGSVDVEVTAFGQVTGHVDDSNDPQEARRAFGAHLVAAPAEGPRLGASVVRFRDHVDGRDETVAAADGLWSTARVEVSAEVAANIPDSGETTWGAYVQGVLHAGWRLHPFVRVEYADLGGFDRVPVVFGVAWKPVDTVVFKVEGLVGGDDTSLGGDGALTSLSVLF